MIQKISFGSTYRILNREYHTDFAKASIPLAILSDNLHYLYEGNEIVMRRAENGDYELKVPHYMDYNVESYCLRKGIAYNKI